MRSFPCRMRHARMRCQRSKVRSATTCQACAQGTVGAGRRAARSTLSPQGGGSGGGGGAAAAQQLGEVSAVAWVLVAVALSSSRGHLWRHRARPSSALLAVVRLCCLLLLHPPVLPPTVAPAHAVHCAGRLVCLPRWRPFFWGGFTG